MASAFATAADIRFTALTAYAVPRSRAWLKSRCCCVPATTAPLASAVAAAFLS